jgi:hypothetical protein
MDINNSTSPKIVSITEFKGRDTIKVLSEAIERTRQGEFVGMIFILDTGKGSTKVGATGSYRKNPRTGIAAAEHIREVLTSQKQHQAGGERN